MKILIRCAAVILCLALLCSCSGRDGEDSSVRESSAESAGNGESGESTVTIENEPGPAEALERELQKNRDKVARDFAAALPSCDAARIAAASNLDAEQLQYFQNVAITSAEVEPMDDVGHYRLTLAVSEPGPTLLMAGTYDYIMQVGHPDYGDGELVVRFIANEKQYRTPDEIAGDRVLWQMQTLRSWTNFGEFSSPQEITMPKLMDFLLIISSFDARERGAEQYEFTQDEINAAAKKYFGFPSFVFTSASEYDKSTGRYVIYGRGGGPLNERIINRVDMDDGTAEVYVEEFSDPLQLMMKRILCYTLAPNDDGSWRFVSCEKVALD